jgi:inosine/xanthosine triphosphatase
MKTIVVASKNPVKLKAAEEGFKAMFPAEEVKVVAVERQVTISMQPMTSAETLQGACERATNARLTQPDADFWMGIEGGVEDTDQGMEVFAWVVVLDREHMGKGRTGMFYLPERLRQLVRGGMELGEADDLVFGRSNSKQANGAVGILTDDAVTRTSYYVPAVIFALIPFKNKELYL